MSMEKRQLGRSDLRVPPLCLGGNVFGWTADKDMSFRLLDRALEAGLDFIDTAEVYSRLGARATRGGESEAIIGEWLASRGCRDRVIIATKVGADMGDGRKGLAPARIRDAVEGSLRRLRTDRIDLYQAHYDDPHDAARGRAGHLRRADRGGQGARHRGVEPHRHRGCGRRWPRASADGLPRYESLQPHYNLYDRRRVRGRARAPVRRAGPRRDLLLRPRQGLPHRQVPVARGSRPEPARRRGRRAIWIERGTAHPGGSGRGGGRASGHTGAGGTGLADRAAEHHRADRQRDLARASSRI